MTEDNRRLSRNISFALLLGSVMLSGCTQGGGKPAIEYPDGNYHGMSTPDSDGAVGCLHFTIKNHKITAAVFQVLDKTGAVKDSKYLNSSDESNQSAAQQKAKAVFSAEQKYVDQFKEIGDANKVDVIAGATLSHNKLLDAVEVALADGPQKKSAMTSSQPTTENHGHHKSG